MTSQAHFVQPPRFATWLVNLFTLPEEESIVGDLFEEFCQLASKSGVGFARRWYWRHSLKTVTHLFCTGFRSAPWSTTTAVVGGFLLGRYAHGVPGKVLNAVTDRYVAFWAAHFQSYTWVLNGMLIVHLTASMFVGCIVALAAKGREMVATMTLGLVLCAMAGVALPWITTHWPLGNAIVWMLWQCAGPFAIVVGGAIVRTRRSAATRLPLGA
jgi:hypothetical protein